MSKNNIEKPLEEVRKWKKTVSTKISKMTPEEEIEYFSKNKKQVAKHLISSKSN